MEQEIQDKLKEIKGRFRLSMNGVASQSMREKGLGYKINWGIGLPVLKSMAAEYGHDYSLAVELWKEDIRECKILATLIMPAAEMTEDLVELWAGQISNQEIAEMASFNLFQHVAGAKTFAMRWLASGNIFMQMCGYLVITRLLIKNEEFSDREAEELIDQAQAAVGEGNAALSHTVVNMLTRLAATGGSRRKMIKSAFKAYDLDIF